MKNVLFYVFCGLSLLVNTQDTYGVKLTKMPKSQRNRTFHNNRRNGELNLIERIILMEERYLEEEQPQRPFRERRKRLPVKRELFPENI